MSKTAATFLVFGFGLAVSVGLKASLNLSEPLFGVFVALSVLTALICFFGNRLVAVDLKALRLELQKVEAAEVSIREVASAIVDVIEANDHCIALESYDSKKAEEAMNRLKKLIGRA